MKYPNSIKIQLPIVILLTFLACSSIFQNKFIDGDDNALIIDWEFTHHIENIFKVFEANTYPPAYSSRYRPVSTILYILNYSIWETNPFGYHLYSIFIQLTSTILVYLITREIVSSISQKKHNTYYIIPFTTALLFGLHPIHAEPIAAMASYMDNTGLMFFLASLYSYIKKKTFVSVVLASLALFNNEMSVTLPVVVIFYDLVFKKITLKKLRSNQAIKRYAPFFLPLIIYLSLRFVFLRVGGGNLSYIGGSFYLTMLTMVKVLIKYLQELIWPINLSNYPKVADGIESYIGEFAPKEKILSQSIFDLDIIARIIILFFIIFIAFRARKKFPLISFSIGWFFITIAPALNIIPVGNLMQERYAYLPSFGFCLLLAYLINWLCGNFRGLTPKILISTFLILYSTFYFYQTFQRNKEWKDPITFWSNLRSHVPENIMANFYLAINLQKDNQDIEAIKFFKKTLDLDYKFNLIGDIPYIYRDIGISYQKLAQTDQAIKNYYQALTSSPDFQSQRFVIDQLANISDNQDRVIVREDGAWLKYADNNLFFFYPKDWSLDSRLTLSDQKNDIKAKLTIESTSLSLDDFVKEDLSFYGQITNQGLAQIPGVDKAYVKFISNAGQDKLLFYLYKNPSQSSSSNKAVKVLFYNSNSSEKGRFDQILSSIRLIY